jgi:fused signal recognition particle receptor
MLFNKNKEEEENKEENKDGFFSRLKKGLSKTRSNFVDKITGLFSSSNSIDDEFFEELEELLIQADVGIHTTMELIGELEEVVDEKEIESPEELFVIFKKKLEEIMQNEGGKLSLESDLNIIMVVGVNGSGKTTTIAKIARRFKEKGNDVMLAAGDTFRAGAIDQLQVWGNRLGIKVIAQSEGSDSAAVAYDAVQSAKAKDSDLLIVDTAGRLHTQTNLMKELQKVRNVIGREAEGANVEVLLVLDATNGQNAISQAKLFDESVDVDGIALTKLDGTAKGGVVVAIKNELGIPIKLIGVGEEAEDLQDFNPDEFVEALFVDEQ